jgi:hypothetical protein
MIANYSADDLSWNERGEIPSIERLFEQMHEDGLRPKSLWIAIHPDTLEELFRAYPLPRPMLTFGSGSTRTTSAYVNRYLGFEASFWKNPMMATGQIRIEMAGLGVP